MRRLLPMRWAAPYVPPILASLAGWLAGSSVGTGSSTSSPSSYTDSVPLGTACSVIWAGYYTSVAPTPTVSASIGGTAATLVGTPLLVSNATTNLYLCCFVLFSPPTGSQTVSFSGAGTGTYFVVMVADHYANVAAVGPATTLGLQAAGSPSMTLTSSNPNYIYANAFTWQATVAAGESFSAYSQTQRFLKALVASGCRPLIVGDAQGTGSSLVFSATRSASENDWGGIILPLAPSLLFDSIGPSVSWISPSSNSFVVNATALSDVYVGITTIAGETFTSATYAGTTMTVLGQVFLNNTSADGQLTVCHLPAVATANGTVVVTKSGTIHTCTANAISYLNVNTTTTPVTVNGASTSASQSTTQTGQRIVQFFGVQSHGFSGGAGGTVRFNAAVASAGLLILDATATATMTGATTSDNWGGMSVILN